MRTEPQVRAKGLQAGLLEQFAIRAIVDGLSVFPCPPRKEAFTDLVFTYADLSTTHDSYNMDTLDEHLGRRRVRVSGPDLDVRPVLFFIQTAHLFTSGRFL